MHKAFTLIELLVVVMIIGILSAIALPQYNKAVERARVSEARLVLNHVYKQHQMCVLENGADADICGQNDGRFANEYVKDMPGTLHTNLDECPSVGSYCWITKNWAYDTDSDEYYATRLINNEKPYFLTIDLSSGDITCVNDSTKDYCKMLCGGNRCAL